MSGKIPQISLGNVLPGWMLDKQKGSPKKPGSGEKRAEREATPDSGERKLEAGRGSGERRSGRMGTPDSGERKLDRITTFDSGEYKFERNLTPNSGERRSERIETPDSGRRKLDDLGSPHFGELSLDSFDSGSPTGKELEFLRKRGVGEKGRAPVSKRGSGERFLSRRKSSELKNFLSKERVSDLTRCQSVTIDELGESNFFSISPRSSSLEMDRIVGQIREHLGRGFSSAVAHILGQISCNQYLYLSPNGLDLAMGLEKERLLEIFLDGVERLTFENERSSSEKLTLNHVKRRRILEMGLRAIGQPHLNYLFGKPEIKQKIQRIVSVKPEKVQTPRFQELIERAKHAVDLGVQGSSREVAQKGLQSLSQLIESSQEREIFKNIKDNNERSSDLSAQKTFLIAINKLLLKKKKCAEKFVLNLGLRILTFPDMRPLFEIVKMKKIAGKIMEMNRREFNSPTTQTLIEYAHVVIHSPPTSLRELQFLLYWIQADFLFSEGTFDLIAGLRGWDLEGNCYRFAIHRFMEMAKWENKDHEVLYRLLQFIYFWRQTPANQDLIALGDDGDWRSLLRCLSEPGLEDFKKEIPKDFLNDMFYQGSCSIKMEQSQLKLEPFLAESDLPEMESEQFFLKEALGGEAIVDMTCQIWKDKGIVRLLRDSIISYLLEARERVTVGDLLFSRKEDVESLHIQARRFNQVIEFLVGQILSSSKEAEKIVKVICQVQKELIDLSAFEAAAAVYAVFQRPSVKKLAPLFSQDELFVSLFDSPEAVFSGKDGGRKLRELQNKGEVVFEALNLFLQDLSQLKEEVPDFTEEGRVNVGKLRQLGKTLNRFVRLKPQLAEYWTLKMKLVPNDFLLMAFQSQSVIQVEMERVVAKIATNLGSEFPPCLFHILGQISFNQYLYLSPSGFELAVGLEKAKLLKKFLRAIEKLLSEQSPLSTIGARRVFEMGLKVIVQPHVSYLWGNSKMRAIVDQIVSVSLKSAQTIKLMELIRKAKKIVQEGGQGCVEDGQRASSSSSSEVSPFSISLKELQFLLLWIQTDFPSTEETFDLVAGIREWDPYGNLYRFAIHRCLDMFKWENRHSATLIRLMHFIYAWRQAPANGDLESFREDADWTRLLVSLQRANLDNFIKEVPEDFLKTTSSLKQAFVKINLREEAASSFEADNHSPEVEVANPLFQARILGEAVPKVPHQIWEDKEIVRKLRDSILFYLLEARQQVTVQDLLSISKKKTEALQIQAKRFNQIMHFLVGQIFACNSLEKAQKIVKIICRVQKELLEVSAFQAALAVHTVFSQASIVRLKGAFLSNPLFVALFSNPDAICEQKEKARELRDLQEKIEGSFEVSGLIEGDLTHLWEGKDADFTGEGKVNLDRRRQFGRVFNRFARRKLKVLEHWNQVKLAPDDFLLMVFQAQGYEIDKDTEDQWWTRSDEIHKHGTKEYCFSRPPL